MCGDGPIWALGAMSGTSLDGVDCALVRTDGHKVAEFGESGYRPYTETERAVLRRALGQADGPDVEAAAEVVELAHAELLSGFPQAELIGFHGQTTLHQPDRALTVQIGNGALLAETLERTVVWDFRSADVHLGGQGAPLAPFYHFALAKRAGFRRPVAFLNIGGVANITWVDPRRDRPEADGALLAFDTGPGNALIDDLCMTRLGRPMDADGVLTRAGQVDEDVLAELLSAEAFFSRMPPKSLDRNDFEGWDTAVSGLSDADAVATLAAGTAGAVALALQHCPEPPERLLVTGGGRRNPGLMELIRGLAACTVVPVEAHGFDGDMLEAQAFAFLAVRVKRGLPTSCAGTTGVAAPVGGGRVSKPGRLLRRAEG